MLGACMLLHGVVPVGCWQLGFWWVSAGGCLPCPCFPVPGLPSGPSQLQHVPSAAALVQPQPVR